MKLLIAPSEIKHHYSNPPKSLRDFNCLPATAIDADKYPILARHWGGPLIVDGQLACNDDSPLAKRYKTRPISEAL